MSITTKRTGELLTVYLSGELDHHIARTWREQIDEEAHRGNVRKMDLDFSGITFMDSSGIGLVMGRYRYMASLGGKLTVSGVDERIGDLMRMAGLDRLGILQQAE